MTAYRKKHLLNISIVVLCCAVGSCFSPPSIERSSTFEIEDKTAESAAIDYRNEIPNLLNAAHASLELEVGNEPELDKGPVASQDTESLPKAFRDVLDNYYEGNEAVPVLLELEVGNEPESDKGPVASQDAESLPKALRDVLDNYYEKNEAVLEETAFNRMIGWKDDFENIADKYPNVNWKMLSAIIKAETQGRTGIQESAAKAIGITQIKYQGAWAFLWDALFSEEIKDGPRYVKDYQNANLRKRYHDQLEQIRKYLEEQKILVKPADRSEPAYSKAKFATWINLKSHLRKKYKPGDYQVAVDIAAMYIDHLIITFRKVKNQIARIRGDVQKNGFGPFNDPQFAGVVAKRWNSIKSRLCYHQHASDIREKILARLDQILSRLEDPGIHTAAYNFGLSKCLKYVESGMDFPHGISQYVKKVARYYVIFNQIDIYKLYS